MSRLRSQLTYANVAATVALIAAVGGGSAAIAISATKAPKNSVVSSSIRNGNVTSRDVARVRVRVASNGGTGSANARCRKGEKLVGGGATGGGDSIPNGNGWRATAPGLARAYALCLSAKPGS